MKAALSIILAMALSSCASVVSQISDGHPNRDHVPVEPGSRAVMLTGTYADADWDGWLELPRGAGPFRPNSGTILKRSLETGNDEPVGVIRAYPNGWIVGNWVYGGIPGLIGDFLGGGSWDLQPSTSK